MLVAPESMGLGALIAITVVSATVNIGFVYAILFGSDGRGSRYSALMPGANGWERTLRTAHPEASSIAAVFLTMCGVALPAIKRFVAREIYPGLLTDYRARNCVPDCA